MNIRMYIYIIWMTIDVLYSDFHLDSYPNQPGTLVFK